MYHAPGLLDGEQVSGHPVQFQLATKSKIPLTAGTESTLLSIVINNNNYYYNKSRRRCSFAQYCKQKMAHRRGNHKNAVYFLPPLYLGLLPHELDLPPELRPDPTKRLHFQPHQEGPDEVTKRKFEGIKMQ